MYISQGKQCSPRPCEISIQFVLIRIITIHRSLYRSKDIGNKIKYT